MQSWWAEGAEDAAEEGGAAEEAGIGVCCCEDGVEDCGEVETVEWRGGGSDDDGGGVREAIADGFTVECAADCVRACSLRLALAI